MGPAGRQPDEEEEEEEEDQIHGCQIFRKSRARALGRPSERTAAAIGPGRRG